jgi:very-short-patch-repair endonuclease
MCVDNLVNCWETQTENAEGNQQPSQNFLCQKRCGKMSKIITTEIYAKKVLENTNGEYTLESEYKGKYGKIKLKHSCGHEYEVQAQAFNANKAKCPVCFGKNRTYTLNEVQKIVNRSLDSSYIVKQYKNKREKIEILHNKCGNTINILLTNIRKGQRCIHCENAYVKKDLDTFKKEVATLGNNEYDVISDSYKNNKDKILIKHLKCNTEYLVRPNDFLSGHRCPYCRISFNEIKIENFLVENNIAFKKQWKIPIDTKKVLRADFYLTKLNTIVEYDGEQHYHPVFGEKELTIQKQRDSLKNKYCEENNINIIRIPYWKKKSIEKILKNKILEGSTTIESTSPDGSE